MKRPKLYRITALLLGAAVVLSAAGTGALAAGATQARNGEMAETTNGALTYWFPKYIAGCDDNTIAQATSNNLSIGGRRITRLSGHGSQYALIRTHTSSVVPFEAALEQLMLLPNGTYTLSAYVASLITEEDKANGAYAKVYVYADDGETALEREIGVSEGATAPWEPVEVPNVVITEGKCRIGFALKSVTQGGNATAGRALAVDGVTLIAADAAVIGGTVSAPTGAGVPYAQIEVLRDGVRVAAATTGNTSGAYADLSVPTGTDYTVRVTASGYEPVVRTGVDIVSAEPQTMDFAFVGYDDSTTYTFGGSDSEYGAEGGYYFDAVLGSDTNDGRSPETAWQTIDKFNATTFQPGDKILFHAGSVWTGVSLVPRGSGTEEAPIVVGKYGPADKMPAFHRNYVPDTPLSEMTANRTNPTLRINGVSHWEFNDLEITNYGQYNADDTHSAQTGRTAVTITSTTGQPDATMRGIRLNGLYVHDVNGANPKSGGGYNNASGSGITWGASGQSKIDGLIIENCLIKNITRNGIVGGGYSGSRVWSQGSGYAQSGVPIRHRNVVVRGNVLDTIAGDGILVSGTLRAVVEYNLVTKACNDPRPYPTLSGNATSNLSAAVWPFDADGTIFQYNEVCYAKVPRGTEVADGEAFDSDYYCTNSLYQYNYSHDNEGGCFMVCGPAYSYTDGTVFRYNISENDGSIYGKRTIFEIGGGGGVNRTYLYNNTIYSGPDHSVFSVVRGEPWDGKPKGTHFINNIFYIDGTVAEFGWAGDLRDKGKEGIVTYDHNLYCGKLFEGVPTWVAPATYNPNPSFLLPLRGNKVLRDMPDDKNAVFGDPRFVSPGGAGDGYESAAAYRIQEGSAALGAGALIDTSRLGQRLVEDYYNAQTPNKAVYFHILGDDFVWQDLNGKHDFFDNPLPVTLPPDIGAHQLSRALEATTALEETEAGVNARFAIYNRTEAAADLLCLYAVYDGAGRLADVHVRPVEGAALTDQEIEEAVGPVAPGHMVRAFVWKAAHEIFVALARAV